MKDYLAHAVPEIEKIISTEQFKLSEKLLDLRFALGLLWNGQMAWLRSKSLYQIWIRRHWFKPRWLSSYYWQIRNAQKLSSYYR